MRGARSAVAGGRPTILLGVTDQVSLRLLAGFPAFLAGRGWDVHVVANGEPPGPADGVQFHTLAMARSPQPAHDVRSLRRWRRLLRAVRPDVVSIGTPKAALLGLVAARTTRVPHRVYKVRGLRLEGSRGVGRGVLWAMEWITMAAAHRALVVSPSLEQRLVKLRVAEAGKLTVLGHGSSNGVDLERFAPSVRTDSVADDLGIQPSAVVIAFIGRMSADKGVPELCEAFATLGATTSHAHLLLVGGIEDASAARAVAEVRERGLPVTALDYVDEVRDLYRRVDVLCLPTHREGFPNVVLEAGACGIPTVTTRATGAVDAVVDEVTGLVVPVGDPAALAAALRRMVEDGALRERTGRAALERTRTDFDQARMWDLEEGFYRSLLRGHHGDMSSPATGQNH